MTDGLKDKSMFQVIIKQIEFSGQFASAKKELRSKSYCPMSSDYVKYLLFSSSLPN